MLYAGFGGNENNFLTKTECELACLGTVLSLIIEYCNNVPKMYSYIYTAII